LRNQDRLEVVAEDLERPLDLVLDLLLAQTLHVDFGDDDGAVLAVHARVQKLHTVVPRHPALTSDLPPMVIPAGSGSARVAAGRSERTRQHLEHFLADRSGDPLAYSRSTSSSTPISRAIAIASSRRPSNTARRKLGFPGSLSSAGQA